MGNLDSKIQVGMPFGTVGSMKQKIKNYAKENHYIASERFEGPVGFPVRIRNTGIFYTNATNESNGCMPDPRMTCLFDDSHSKKIIGASAQFEGLRYDTNGNIPDYDNEDNIKFKTITDGKYIAFDKDGNGYVGLDEIEEIKQE